MSSTAVATYVHARDPISQAGVVAQLRMRPEIRVVDSAAEAAVAVMIADTVDESTTRELRAMRNDGQPRLMLVATAVDDAALVAAAEAGALDIPLTSASLPDASAATRLHRSIRDRARNRRRRAGPRRTQPA